MDHLFLEAINQPKLTRIWGGAVVGGGCEGHLTWFSGCLLGALLIDVVEISADCVTISGQGWLLFAQPFPDFSWESVLPTFKISFRHQHGLNPELSTLRYTTGLKRSVGLVPLVTLWG